MPRAKGTPHTIDRTGQIFGQWTVLRRHGGSVWWCQCACGTKKAVSGSTLTMGTSKSCGCTQHDVHRKHGMEGTPTYNAWAHMLYRCRNPNAQGYESYGGRGIKVCKRWVKFENFYADMGEKPDGLSIDREDNDGDYKPSNCRWATVRQQIRNRQGSPRHIWNGEMLSLADITEKVGVVPWRKAYERMRQGWTLQDAVTIKRANRWRRK